MTFWRDKHYLVTGGHSGIGWAVAQELLAGGAQVWSLARRVEPACLEAGLRQIPVDLASRGERRLALEKVLERCEGRLDGLVLNAAWYRIRPQLAHPDQEVGRAIKTNLLAALDLIRGCLPALRAGSGKSVVHVSSTLARRPCAGGGLYAATKAAVDALLASLALEFAPEGLRFNSVLPGVVDTAIHEPGEEAELPREEKMKQFARLHPLGRVGRPEEIAAAVLFLLGERSPWTTGSQMTVDGGISLV
jgi:NAD(P)-dependent dehydrogenase (short-subunit alcohol dehydrogenase family)